MPWHFRAGPVSFSADDYDPAPVHIGGDLWALPEIVIEIVGEESLGFDAEIRVVFDHLTGTFVADSILAKQHSGGITGAMLRRLPLLEYVRAAVPQCILIKDGEGSWVGFSQQDGLVPDWVSEQARLRGPDEESLRWVARIYLLARALALPPAQAVAKELGLPQRTASHWIAKARGSGLLAPRLLEYGFDAVPRDRLVAERWSLVGGELTGSARALLEAMQDG